MRSWITHAPVVGVWEWFRCDLAFPFWKDWHSLSPPALVSLARAENHRQRTRSEGHSKSLSAKYVPTDLLLLTQRMSRPVPHRLLYHPAPLPFAAPPQVRRLCHWSCLHGVWRRGSCCPARLAGSCAQFDSAMRFSLPGDLPSSTAFLRRRWQSGTPLSCVRRLLSSWQRMQSSQSLQPRWGRGFTALTSLYPRKVVAFDQSWICESWTGLCTSSRSRCWRTGTWSNASSPRYGLQQSTLRTYMFRFFRNTDRSYG